MIAIWTNTNDEVVRRHFKPELLDTEAKSDAYIVDSIPEDNAGSNEVPTLHYNTTDGFWYTYQTKKTNLPIPAEDEQALKDAVNSSDFNTVVEIIDSHI